VVGTIPNRTGQPLIVDWLVVTILAGKLAGPQDLDAWTERARLGAAPTVNTGQTPDLGPRQSLLPHAVAAVRAEVLRRRATWTDACASSSSHGKRS
jgi:hypothetical protein